MIVRRNLSGMASSVAQVYNEGLQWIPEVNETPCRGSGGEALMKVMTFQQKDTNFALKFVSSLAKFNQT